MARKQDILRRGSAAKPTFVNWISLSEEEAAHERGMQKARDRDYLSHKEWLEMIAMWNVSVEVIKPGSKLLNAYIQVYPQLVITDE